MSEPDVCAHYKEYEGGKTPEAVLVKDLDTFDMIFQALEYEKCMVLTIIVCSET